MLSSSLASKRFWYRDEDDAGVYISLPYSIGPTSGMFGGPPTTGGPPGSSSRRHDQGTRPPLETRHTLSSIKLSFEDRPKSPEIYFPYGLDAESPLPRSVSKDVFELNNHKLVRVTGQDCLHGHDESCDDPGCEHSEYDPEYRIGLTAEDIQELEEMVREYEAGYAPQAVPGYQEAKGETEEPIDPWHPGSKHYHWDDLPSRPVADDPYASEPFFISPPMDNLQTYPGYENVGNFDETAKLSTPTQLPPLSGQPPAVEFDSVVSLGEQQCREALVDMVGQHCCYGKSAARDMKFTQIVPSSALHYILETYAETRETGYKHEPYRGGPIDSAQGGELPPLPWDVPCTPDRLFKDQVKKIEVAHTSSVQICHACQARGFNRCYRCQGIGFVRCHHCHGDKRISRTDAQGHTHRDSCLACGEEGRKRCSTCHGDGCIMCKLCRGYRQLRCYVQLTVVFKNHKGEYLVEKTDLPDKLVKQVKGVTIFEQTMEQVWPLTTYPVEDVNENSMKLVEKHRSAYTNARHIHQRHHLEAVPLTEVHYQWKSKTGQLWVYGKERTVHAPDYPQKSCCGCVIL